MVGWVRLWRSSEQDWKWKKPHYWKAWCWMLLHAAYKDGPNLKKGQLEFLTSWAPEIWGMSESTAQRFLRRCEKEGDVVWERKKGKRKSDGVYDGVFDAAKGVITICRYCEYQDSALTDDGVYDAVYDAVSLPNSFSYKEKEKNKNKSKSEQLDEIRKKFPELQEDFPYRDVREKFQHWLDWMDETGKRPKRYMASFRNFLRVKDWEKNLKAQLESTNGSTHPSHKIIKGEEY